MLNLIKVKPLKSEFLSSIGLSWHTDLDDSAYIANSLVKITNNEANAYYEAVNTLYDMYVKASQYVIDNELFHDIGIPFNLINIIKNSWENDVHWHLYGRFDLAGGVDGKPIKLIEFNADTPTALFETSIIQWAILKANGMDEASQFNNVYDAIKENFKRLITLNEDTSEFSNLYDGWKILFSSIAGNIEDENTTRLLQSIANEAGFVTEFSYVDEVEFSETEGIFKNNENYEYWFKLIPWENIGINEGNLALILQDIIDNQKAIILNPAYTLLFQSKGILKILWDLFPNHPLLLEASFQKLENKKQVKKPCFGREGANISIINKNGNIEKETSGEYDNFPYVYQEFVEFPQDEERKNYQAGVFFAYEACGLGYRRGEGILNNSSKFLGHIIDDTK